MKYNNNIRAIVLCIVLVPAVSFGMEHEPDLPQPQPQSIWQKIVNSISSYMPARPEWTKNITMPDLDWAYSMVSSLSYGQKAALRAALSSGGYLASAVYKKGTIDPKHLVKAFKKGAQTGVVSYGLGTGKAALKYQVQKSELNAFSERTDRQIAQLPTDSEKIEKLKELLQERAKELFAVDSKAKLIKNKISEIKDECAAKGDTGCV